MNKSIAILATGDEIITGDILNTNVQYIAAALTNANMFAGMQMTASDTQADIETAMQFLLERHDALITIGGLGPTSDDRTRFALSAVTNLPLEFRQEAWEAIVARMMKYNFAIPETNKQQALFPQTAIVIPNNNGSAAGCILKWQNKIIFMLPGPPHECYPMVDDAVIPALILENFPQKIYRKTWLLLGASEGLIAEKLDGMVLDTDCIVGYRVSFPCVEVKLFSYDEKKLTALAEKFTPELQSYLVSENKQTPAHQLVEFLATYTNRLYIQDEATGGLLQTILLTPKTHAVCSFVFEQGLLGNGVINIKITGLENFWRNTPTTHDEVFITISEASNSFTIKRTVIVSSQLTRNHAVELICWELLQYLKN